MAQESETRLPPEWVERLEPFMRAPELYVEPDLRGYGWYFPKRDFINIGIGCTRGGDGSLPRRRDALMARLRASGPAAGGHARSSRSRGTRTWCGGRRPGACSGARFCLVGDAAGLARDLSGEGIGPAIRSGLLAAEAVAAFIRAGHAARRATRGRSWRCYGPRRARLARAPARAAARTRGAARRCGSCSGSESGAAAHRVRFHLRHEGGRRHERRLGPSEHDAQAIAHHYDVSNDFYALFLDPLMVYTCAYYREPDGKLEQAQEDKLDLVCRKLRLKPGETRARHRLRLGRLSHLGRPALRRSGARGDALEGPGRMGGRAHQAGRARGALPRRVPRRPRPARRRPLRQDRGDRGHRARGHPELPRVLRPRPARC